jgi:nitroreductase
MEKPALIDAPIHDLIKRRWSPTVFADQPVPPDSLRRCFEAARWAASCFNEQPWSFVTVSRHDDLASFHALLACLTPGNQAWVKAAPLLGFSLARTHFKKTGKPNLYARHDVGMAMANFCLQATDLGLFVHQMAGFDIEAATATLALPETHEVVAAFAMGFGVKVEEIPAELKEKELRARERRPQEEFVFKGVRHQSEG